MSQEVQIGCAFLPKFQRRGFGTEAVEAFTSWALDSYATLDLSVTVQFDTCRTLCFSSTPASRRVIELARVQRSGKQVFHSRQGFTADSEAPSIAPGGSRATRREPLLRALKRDYERQTRL